MTSTLSTDKKSGRWPCLTEPGGRRRLKRSPDGSRENRSRKLSHTRGLILPHAYCTIEVPNTWAVPNRTSFDRPRDHESQNRKAHFRVGRTCSEPWQGGGGGGPDGGVVGGVFRDLLVQPGAERLGGKGGLHRRSSARGRTSPVRSSARLWLRISPTAAGPGRQRPGSPPHAVTRRPSFRVA